MNDEIKQSSPEVLDMMSHLGKDMFYPKEFYRNLPKQNAQHIMLLLVWQPKEGKMYANSLNQMFNDLTPDEIFPYAPPQGVEELRDLWQKKCLKKIPT